MSNVRNCTGNPVVVYAQSNNCTYQSASNQYVLTTCNSTHLATILCSDSACSQGCTTTWIPQSTWNTCNGLITDGTLDQCLAAGATYNGVQVSQYADGTSCSMIGAQFIYNPMCYLVGVPNSYTCASNRLVENVYAASNCSGTPVTQTTRASTTCSAWDINIGYVTLGTSGCTSVSYQISKVTFPMNFNTNGSTINGGNVTKSYIGTITLIFMCITTMLLILA